MNENKSVIKESNEYYLTKYEEKLKVLEEKDELWRQILSREEFLEKLIEIKHTFRYNENFNEYFNQQQFNGLVGVLYHVRVTFEEATVQAEQIDLELRASLTKKAPKFKKRLQKLTLPLSPIQWNEISNGLFYGQITEEDIPEAILDALKETQMFLSIKKRMD
jgi:hypothetical protein